MMSTLFSSRLVVFQTEMIHISLATLGPRAVTTLEIVFSLPCSQYYTGCSRDSQPYEHIYAWKVLSSGKWLHDKRHRNIPQNGSRRFHQNFCNIIPDCTALHPVLSNPLNHTAVPVRWRHLVILTDFEVTEKNAVFWNVAQCGFITNRRLYLLGKSKKAIPVTPWRPIGL
jgi:hypothetical protein